MLNRPINPWWTVVAGSLASAVGAGTIMVYTYGILSAALGEEFGWSREILARNMTAFLIGSGVGTVTLGSLIARLGIRTPSALMAGAFGLLFASVALLPAEPSLFPPLFFLIGICGAACTALPYAVAISGFFDQRRGLALGIVVAGSGAGSTFGPAIAQHLVTSYGWRAGFEAIGAAAGLVAIVGLVLLVRTPPATRRMASAAGAGAAPTPLAALYPRNRYFWLIAVPMLAVSVATFGGMSSLVPYFRDERIDAATIAGALSFAGFASWIGRVAVGYALDKVFAPVICAITFVIAAAGLLLLVDIRSPVQAYLGAAMVAVAMGAEADLVSFLVSRYFRLIDYSRVLGVMWVVWAWGGGLGSFLASESFERLGAYHPAFFLFAGALVVGAAVIFGLGPYANPVRKPDEAPVEGGALRLHRARGKDVNEIDDFDRRILRTVQRDCSLSTAQLAEVIGLSQPACWRRLQRLKETGYILREVAVLDRDKLGFGAQVYALVKLSTVGRANLSGFAEAIRALPEVVECHVLMGVADFLLKIVTPDIHAYERFFFERLSALEGVQDITSAVALSEIKAPTGLPL